MSKRNVLFSDANHGGLVLLEEYAKYTSNNLFFYDIYGKLSDSEKEDYCERFNVTFLSLDDVLADEDAFVKVNPVHMPPVFGTDYTHHEFVSYLLGKMGCCFKLIQVTGVKGKTSVASLIGDVLGDYNTLVLTSNGLSYNGRVLLEHLSIAPSSIITAVREAYSRNILDDIDFCVFEVSLGVVPGGYLNVLTNVLEDYPIGRGSSCASVAKSSVFSSEITLCDYGAYNEFYEGFDCVTLGLDDKSADISACDISYGIENTSFVVNYFDKKYPCSLFALSNFYINNLLFAISVGLLLNIDVDIIFSKLRSSRVVKGRNSYQKLGDKIIIEDINPGLNTSSIRKCIENLEKFNTDYQLILGGDYGITCEEIDEDKLVNYIESIADKNIVFTGRLGYNLLKKLKHEFPYFEKLYESVEYILENTSSKLIQIIYRSEYKKYDSDLNYLNNTE